MLGTSYGGGVEGPMLGTVSGEYADRAFSPMLGTSYGRGVDNPMLGTVAGAYARGVVSPMLGTVCGGGGQLCASAGGAVSSVHARSATSHGVVMAASMPHGAARRSRR